jgi:autotransporter-associated beta strand protein
VKTFNKKTALPAGIISFVLLLAGVPITYAATDTWGGNASANFSTGGWTGGNNPPLTADLLVFNAAGSFGATLNNDLTAGLVFNTITFGATAPAYTIGGNAFTLGTSTAGTSLTITSGGGAQAINDNITLGNAAQTLSLAANLTLGGALSSAGSSSALTQTGSGTLGFSGGGTISGNLLVSGGKLNVTAGTLTASGSGSTIGNTASASAVASVSSGATLTFSTTAAFGSAASSSGVLYNNGTLNVSGGSGNAAYLGYTAAGYGYIYNNGTMAVANRLWMGQGSGAVGVLDIVGGTVTVSGAQDTVFQLCSYGSGANGAGVNINGGTLTLPARQQSLNYAPNGTGNSAYSAINVYGSGSKITVPAGGGFNLMNQGSVNNYTTISLANGGEFDVQYLFNSQTTYGECDLNFNNGILKATGADGTGLIQNNTAVYIHSGGATINANSLSSKILSPFLAPTGNGVTSIALGGTATGYVGAPLVKITGGGGQGAAAIANFNPTTGTITGITITSPGSGYTSAPTVALLGGNGGTTGAGAGSATATATIGAVSGGALTIQGPGQITLNGTATYTGGTTVNTGSLVLSTESQLGAIPGSPTVNVTLNGGELVNNNSSPSLSANRTISLGSSGGYIEEGWNAAFTFTINGLITGSGGFGVAWDSGIVVLNAVNNYQGDTTIGTTGQAYYSNASANPTLRIGIDNALPYGASVGNVVFGTSALSNTSKMDLYGHNLQINGLTGSANATIDSTTGSGTYTLTIGNNNQSGSFAGVIKNTSGKIALATTGTGKLTLSGVNTYTGPTIIGAGTLALSGSGSINISPSITVSNAATFDVSGVTSYALAANQILQGVGVVTGNVASVSSTIITPGLSGVGTLSFSNNLNLASGGKITNELSTVATSGNDQIIVGGNLTLSSSDSIYINALSGSLQAADYVLFNVAGTTTMSTTPALIWIGTVPSNYLNYSLLQVGNNIVLHYTVTSASTVTATASRSAATRNQSFTITATVTPGTSPTITAVNVNLSQIGGSATASLILSNNYVYTNTFTVAAGATTGSQTLSVTATDGIPLTSPAYNLGITINAASQVWNGGAGDNNWSSNPNWAGGAAPGYIGDSVTFSNTVRLTPNMDTNYSVTGVTFDSTAGSFTIGTANSSTLTNGSGGIVNNSTSAQTLNVPVVMSAAQTLNAAAGNITLGSTVNNGGSLLTVDGAANTAVSGAISDTGGGITKTGNGTLTLSGVNSFTGTFAANAGRVSITANSTTASAGFNNIGNTASAGAAVSTSGGGSLIWSGANGGNLGGQTSASGVLYNDGTFNITGTTANSAGTYLGNATTAYGYIRNTGAGAVFGRVWLGEGTGALGVLDVVSGTFLVGGTNQGTAPFLLAANSSTTASYAGVNVTGGTLSLSQPQTFTINTGNSNYTAINITGTGKMTMPAGGGFNLGNTANTNNVCTLTVASGGELDTSYLWKAGGTASSFVNLNGGTIKAVTTDGTGLIQSVQTAIYVYSGGGTIDANGFNAKITGALLAPTGNGVTSIALGGTTSGYIGAPLVEISGGGGQGAAAIANFDPTTGSITSITVTAPGSGYTSAPTVTLLGGNGGTSGSAAGTATATASIAAVSSGGMTFTATGGIGTNTLSAANTYTGNTTISAGTLALSGSGSLASPKIILANGAKFDVSGLSSTFALGSGQTLTNVSGTGNIAGNVNLASGALALSYTNGMPSLSVTNGTLAFNSNAVTVAVAGSLPHGIYKLISTNSGGLVSGTLPATVTANGIGTATASLSISNGELYLTVNHPPVAGNVSYYRNVGINSLRITISDLLTNVTDADGDTLTLVSTGTSTNGIVLTSLGTNYLGYYNPNNVDDQFSYTVTDGFGGTSSGLVSIVVSNASVGQITGQFTSFTGGVANLTFHGIPNYSYITERSTNLTDWVDVVTNNAATNGVISVTDSFGDLGNVPPISAYYRLKWQP